MKDLRQCAANFAKCECVNAIVVGRVRAVIELMSVKNYAWIGFVAYTVAVGHCMTNKNRNRNGIICKKLKRN